MDAWAPAPDRKELLRLTHLPRASAGIQNRARWALFCCHVEDCGPVRRATRRSDPARQAGPESRLAPTVRSEPAFKQLTSLGPTIPGPAPSGIRRCPGRSTPMSRHLRSESTGIPCGYAHARLLSGAPVHTLVGSAFRPQRGQPRALRHRRELHSDHAWPLDSDALVGHLHESGPFLGRGELPGCGDSLSGSPSSPGLEGNGS